LVDEFDPVFREPNRPKMRCFYLSVQKRDALRREFGTERRQVSNVPVDKVIRGDRAGGGGQIAVATSHQTNEHHGWSFAHAGPAFPIRYALRSELKVKRFRGSRELVGEVVSRLPVPIREAVPAASAWSRYHVLMRVEDLSGGAIHG
jgi:hypothetical protein